MHKKNQTNEKKGIDKKNQLREQTERARQSKQKRGQGMLERYVYNRQEEVWNDLGSAKTKRGVDTYGREA